MVTLCIFGCAILAAAITHPNSSQGFQKTETASPEQKAKAALAIVRGNLRAPGLRGPVEVLRDTWGVPHIFAKNQHDLFFAQGFVAAQDRLFQMEMWKRAGQGRLAGLEETRRFYEIGTPSGLAEADRHLIGNL